jgi:hypothetical protein
LVEKRKIPCFYNAIEHGNFPTFSPEISIKNLRQPEILLNKQWKTLTKQFSFLVFFHNFAVGKTENCAGIVARQHFLVIV